MQHTISLCHGFPTGGPLKYDLSHSKDPSNETVCTRLMEMCTFYVFTAPMTDYPLVIQPHLQSQRLQLPAKAAVSCSSSTPHEWKTLFALAHVNERLVQGYYTCWFILCEPILEPVLPDHESRLQRATCKQTCCDRHDQIIKPNVWRCTDLCNSYELFSYKYLRQLLLVRENDRCTCI